MIDGDGWKRLEVYGTTNMFRIIEFLYKNYPKGYLMEELRNNLNLSENAVYNALRHLKEKNKVEHKQPFWRWNKDFEKLEMGK